MKIIVIKPSSTSGLFSEKVTKFKLDMSQFNVMGRVDFFKQTSANVVNVFISKEKLQKNFKKLESKLKTETAENKALQIKKIDLEKKIIEMNKDRGNEVITSLLQEKDIEIQALKNKLKIPHDADVQIIELEIVFQEKKTLMSFKILKQ